MTTPEARAGQRRTIRAICDVLRSDLYDRTGGGEEYAEWSAPGDGPRVQYGYGEDEAVWCKCLRADGTVYAETTDATPEWLDREML
jgi:hypothetical protein